MYADDLLVISSTCSDLRRMLRTVFSKPWYMILSLLIPQYFSDTGILRIPSLTVTVYLTNQNCIRTSLQLYAATLPLVAPYCLMSD